MFSITPLPEFTAWLDKLADSTVQGVVVATFPDIDNRIPGPSQLFFVRRVEVVGAAI